MQCCKHSRYLLSWWNIFSKVTVSLNWHTNPLLWTPSSYGLANIFHSNGMMDLRGRLVCCWCLGSIKTTLGITGYGILRLGTASKVQCSAYYTRYERDRKHCQDLEIGKLLSWLMIYDCDCNDFERR